MVEKFVLSEKHRYAGKVDLVAPIDGVYTLADLKTSATVQETHKLQMGGYYGALPEKPERAYLISVHPDTKKNPALRAHIVEMSRDELEGKYLEFVELVEEFHRQGLCYQNEERTRNMQMICSATPVSRGCQGERMVDER